MICGSLLLKHTEYGTDLGDVLIDLIQHKANAGGVDHAFSGTRLASTPAMTNMARALASPVG